ncbi:hypothetical protein NL676_010064 [Syzygium grande]|nr:hypothetical protein NL676_010064 [Syzygium grande]
MLAWGCGAGGRNIAGFAVRVGQMPREYYRGCQLPRGYPASGGRFFPRTVSIGARRSRTLISLGPPHDAQPYLLIFKFVLQGAPKCGLGYDLTAE